MRLLKLPSKIICIISVIAFFPSHAFASKDLWKRQGWKTDFEKSAINFSEILSGGPPKDGIPSIDNPIFKAISQVKDIGENEPVISLQIDGKAKAYPLRIMMWHEIVNDELSSKPITVTYCPLCNSAIVFERNVDGKLLDFGTTGKLRNSDLVMYDRQTESWWQQFTGRAIVGSYLNTKLKTIPARVESYKLFKKRYPSGLVLVPNNPNMRQYGSNPYFGYDSRNAPYPFYQGDLPSDINPMARVIVFKVDGKPTAVAQTLLQKEKNYKVKDILLTWTAGQNSALDKGQIKNGKDVGNITVQKQTANGLTDIVYDVTFAFVFHSFHKDLPIIK